MQRVYFKASSNELQFISNAIAQFQSCINYKIELNQFTSVKTNLLTHKTS